MQKLGYMHGDIRPENVQVKLDGSVKLSDFSFSSFFKENEKSEKHLSVRSYLCPEVYTTQECCDVWSVAVFIFHMLDLKLPFAPKNSRPETIMKQVVKHEPRLLRGEVSQRLLNLLMLMVQKNPALRPTPKQIIDLELVKPYLGEIDT